MQKVAMASPRWSLFFITWLGLCLVYFFPLTHFSLSIDGEFDDNFHHTVTLGRWGHAFLRAWLLPEPFIPYFTLMLALAVLALAAVVCAALLTLSWQQSLVFSALFASTPQLAYQLQFINQADTVALGYLLMVLGVAAFQRSWHAPQRLYWAVAAVLCWLYAMAIYQSLVVLAPLLWIGMLLLAPSESAQPVKRQMASLIALGVGLAIAGGLYVLLSRWFQALLVGNASYAQLNEGYLAGFLAQPQALSDYAKGVAQQMATLLAGRAYYGAGTLVLVTLAVLASIALTLKPRSPRALWRGLLLLGLLLTPISLALTSEAPLPARVWVGVNLLAAIVAAMLYGQFTAAKARLVLTARWPARLMAGGIGAVFLIHTAGVSTLFAADHHVRQQDVLLANRIITTVYLKYPALDLSQTPVYFHGAWQPPSRHALPNAETFGGSFFAWDGGNNIRLERFFAYYGIAHFATAGREATQKALQEVNDMPTWPHPEAIQQLDDVLIIKLGEQRGWLPFSVEE